jgi:hypothetical protein
MTGAPSMTEVAIAAMEEALGPLPWTYHLEWTAPLVASPPIPFVIYKGHIVMVRDEEYIAVRNILEVTCYHIMPCHKFKDLLTVYENGHYGPNFCSGLYAVIEDFIRYQSPHIKRVTIYDPNSIDVIKRFVT